MKRLLTLIVLAAVTAGPAAAQNLPTNAGAQRQTIDTASISRALQARGIPDDQIAASLPRIRYWLSLGASPARIRAFLNQQNGNTRPDLPDVEARPDAPVARGPVVARRDNVQSVDTVRISPRTVRPTVTQPLAGK
ncbi:MAG: hypothetical protein AB7I36_20895 [Rhodospirillaceae bacterium]